MGIMTVTYIIFLVRNGTAGVLHLLVLLVGAAFMLQFNSLFYELLHLRSFAKSGTGWHFADVMAEV
jgi:hypothetical protein